MHELSIASNLYETCRRLVDGEGSGRLESVTVAVGELTAVEPEQLGFAWEVVTSQGPDAGCRLDIEWRRARQFCEQCGEEKARPEARWLRVCPDCWRPLRVDGGDELDLLHVTFQPPEDPGRRADEP
jgi:hydrogenase nickel incorporation protein HypA/HybF